MRPLVSAVAHTRRNIRVFLLAGVSLAVASAGIGIVLFCLGRPRPDVTLTFSELGEYVTVLGLLHLLLYAGLYWQIGRLSRRPRLLPGGAPAASAMPPGSPVERA